MKIVNSKLKHFNMISLDVYSCSVESEFCMEEKFVIKLTLVSISHVTLRTIKPKRAAIMFYKKVAPLNV